MSKGKAPLATELVYLSVLNKADIQKNLILPERDGSLYTQFFYDVLSVRISGQAADAPIRRKTSKRYIHAKVNSMIRSMVKEEAFCDMVWKEHNEEKSLMLSIENMGSYIGYCGIKDTSQDLWEIAIELKRDWTKHGIGYPALSTMLNAIKSRLGVTEFRVRIDPTNYPSQKLFERLGAIPNGLSELWLHDQRALEKYEEENLHLIDDRIVEVAKKFQVEPQKLLSHVLEYRLSWTEKGEADGQV